MSNPMSVYPVLFIMKLHPLSCVLMMHSCRLFHLATYLNTFPSTHPSPSTSSWGGGGNYLCQLTQYLNCLTLMSFGCVFNPSSVTHLCFLLLS